VTRIEHLGADRLLYGVFGDPFPDARVIANLPATASVAVQQGESYEFAVRRAALSFFDRTTGRRTAPKPLVEQP
jgi:multiple sugar transport system ATP-binding protein